MNYISLLNKIKSGHHLNCQELKALFDWINMNGVPKELEESFEDFWQKAKDKNDEVESDKLYNGILSQLNISRKNKKVYINNWYIRIMKYAAIFIIGFAFAWILSNSGFPGMNEIVYSQTIVPAGAKSKVILPDGTVVNLNSKTSLRYPADFNSKDRTVYLDGEGFFEVTKNKRHPFVVKTNGLDIKVLGTKFNVCSYPDDDIIETTVVEGKVSVETNSKRITEDQNILLTPDKSATYIKRDNILTTKKVDTELFTSWKDGYIKFHSVDFESVLKLLSRNYGIEIEITDDSLRTLKFSGKLELKKSIENVIQVLQYTIPVKYTYQKDKILINRRLNNLKK